MPGGKDRLRLRFNFRRHHLSNPKPKLEKITCAGTETVDCMTIKVAHKKEAADDDDEAHAANHGRVGKDLFDSWYAEEVDTVDI